MVQQNPKQFFDRGRDHITELAQAIDHMEIYAATYEARGGADALGDYGNDTLGFIYLRNDLAQWLTPERRALLAKYRSDL